MFCLSSISSYYWLPTATQVDVKAPFSFKIAQINHILVVQSHVVAAFLITKIKDATRSDSVAIKRLPAHCSFAANENLMGNIPNFS